MYKLLVSDFDGTLVGEELAIDYSTMLAIDKIRREKVLFAIATSRCLGDILYYNRDFSFLDYVIASNGAVVYDVNREKILFKKSISVVSVRKIYKAFKDYQIYACRKDRKFILVNLEDIKDIYKLEIVCNDLNDVEKVILILDELGLNINYTKQYINGTYAISIVSACINKFKGIEVVCDKIKINIDVVVAIGSSYNDIEMVRDVGVGVAMGDALEEVKSVAKEVTTDNLHKGVEKFIEEKFR